MSTGVAETHERRIAALEEQVAGLRNSIAQFDRRPSSGNQRQEASASDIATFADEAGLGSQFARVREFTTRMFPGNVSVEMGADPECPHERFVLFQVTAAGEVEELIRSQQLWNRGVLRLAPDALNSFRIAITPA